MYFVDGSGKHLDFVLFVPAVSMVPFRADL
jgi:hypothetical protein